MASAGARAYNGGLKAEPPAGSRGRAPGQGVRGRSLLSFQGTMKVAKFTPLTNWQTDFCHVSTTLNRVPYTSLLRSEDCRIKAAEGLGGCLVKVHILNKIGQIVLQL